MFVIRWGTRLGIGLGIGAQSHAAFDGMFSAEEKAKHWQNIELITSVAARCLDNTYADHIRFYDEWKVSKYYGNRREDLNTDQERRKLLRQYGYTKKQIDKIAPQMVATACIDLAMDCLEQGFAAAGTQSTWNKIYTQLSIGRNFYGHELQLMLQQLGWKLYYWNPDPTQNVKWDAEDRTLNPLPRRKKWNAVWGGHAAHYAEVMKEGTYHGMPIDNKERLVGFGSDFPANFETVPFFVGIAHAGYHVFPGRRGEVIEAHSMRDLNSRDNMEFSWFSPLARGGGPKWTRTEKYRSGVIAVPSSINFPHEGRGWFVVPASGPQSG
ncbi:MAG: hypothetical protein AB7G93_02415 [Bdellovibrionales bacterium]